MPTANQLQVTRDDVIITEADLVEIPKGTVSEAGVRKNINVGILYIESWLRGHGAVALYNLMEDAIMEQVKNEKNKQFNKEGNVLRLLQKNLGVEATSATAVFCKTNGTICFIIK